MCAKPQQVPVQKKRGFTLLFAVLVSVLVLAVGASIISIALKQVILSGAGRESQYAFYAANTGIECALFWDLNGSEIINGEIKYVFAPPGQPTLDTFANVRCAGGNITTGTGFTDPSPKFTGAWDTSTPGRTVFKIAITNDINDDTRDIMYCAEVTVEKEEVDDVIVTTITSQGLNSCDPDNDPRAVERGLVLQYTS